MNRSPMRRRSPRMVRLMAGYLRQRETFLLANPECGVCRVNRATQIHHRKGRLGALLVDERFWLAVCYPCHGILEANPAWAREQGYSLDRLGKVEE